MEKKNFTFKAFDSKGNEIKMVNSMYFYGIDKAYAAAIGMGIEIGLRQKYAEPYVIFREMTEEERVEDRQKWESLLSKQN